MYSRRRSLLKYEMQLQGLVTYGELHCSILEGVFSLCSGWLQEVTDSWGKCAAMARWGQKIPRYQWVRLGEHGLQHPVKRPAWPTVPARLPTRVWRWGSHSLRLLPKSSASDSGAGVWWECNIQKEEWRHPIIRASNKRGISLACDIQWMSQRNEGKASLIEL